ncbi:MAG: PASTA domain-containing protein [bacterium]
MAERGRQIDKKDRKQFFRPKFNIDNFGSKMALIIISAALLSVIAGFIIANYIVMPWIIRSGSEIVIPDITGMHINEASRIIKREGLSISVSDEIYSDKIDQSVIVSQTPLPNTKVKFSKTIEIVISKGAEKLIVPTVRNLFINDAVSLIENNGFTVKDTVYSFSGDISENNAINTNPPSGTIATKGSGVILYVSRGNKSDYVNLPSFIAMSPDSAQALARRNDIHIGEFIEQPGDYDRPTVIMQSPDSGVWVLKGDTINLTVGIPVFNYE